MQQDYVIPNKTYFIFLTPDSFWSEGTFNRLYELAQENYKVVMAMGLRVNAEDMSKDIDELLKNHTIPLTVANHELLPLVFKNLHKMSKAHDILSKNKFLNTWPSHLYWIDYDNQQLFAHCFHLHPLMVRSPETPTVIGMTIDTHFLDNLGYDIEDFYIFQSKYFAVELSSKERNWNKKLSNPSLKSITKFSIIHANKMHWDFFKHRITIGNNTSTTTQMDKFIDDIIRKVPCVRATCLGRLLWKGPFISARRTYLRALSLPMKLVKFLFKGKVFDNLKATLRNKRIAIIQKQENS